MPSPEVWPIKAKEVPSPHEVRLTSLDTNPVFLCLRGGGRETKSMKNGRGGNNPFRFYLMIQRSCLTKMQSEYVFLKIYHKFIK